MLADSKFCSSFVLLVVKPAFEALLRAYQAKLPSIPVSRCTLSAHHHLSHSNTIHANPRLFTGIRNVS
jgi:hypothetical protein